jgi:hypothetical protein
VCVTNCHAWLQDVVDWREWLEGFRKYFGVPASKVRDDDPVIQSLKLLLCTTIFLLFDFYFFYLLIS